MNSMVLLQVPQIQIMPKYLPRPVEREKCIFQIDKITPPSDRSVFHQYNCHVCTFLTIAWEGFELFLIGVSF